MGGAGMMLAMVDSSSGAASAAATKPAMASGVAGQHQQAAHELVDRVQAELEAGGDAEVAAAAADGPEQLGMGLGVDLEQAAVGGHHLGGQQVVDGQAVLSDQIARCRRQG